MLSVGAVVGGHRLERLHSVGPAGESYLARRLDDGSLRRLTVLASDRATTPVRERALTHGAALRRARCPGVLPVLEAGEDDGQAWAVTEYVGGDDLATVIRSERPLQPPRALRLVADVAQALDAAHAAGLVHGHLEPAGILVVAGRGDAREYAVIADMGLGPAQALVHDLTRTGRARTSLAFVAPEQLDGRTVGPGSDQYSLACVLRACLTGRPLLTGATRLSAVTEPPGTVPPSASTLAAGLSRELEAVMARALSKVPAARFPTCTAFVTAARSALLGPAARVAVQTPPLALVVVGGPACGLRVPLARGQHLVGRSSSADVVLPDPLLSREHLRLEVGEDRAAVEDLGSANGTWVQGSRVRGHDVLHHGHVVEAGTSVLTLASALGPSVLPQPFAHLLATLERAPTWEVSEGLEVRVGWRRTADGVEPIMVDLAATGRLAVRAEPMRAAALARWVVVQLAVARPPSLVRVAAALQPSPEDLWSWLALLPHARPDGPPLHTPHSVTDRRSAAVLAARLQALVEARDRITRDVHGGKIQPLLPRVVAVLDGALVGHDQTQCVLRLGPAAQVHPVSLTAPGQTLPEETTAVVDIAEPAGDLTLRVPGAAPVTGTADGLLPSLARRVAGALASL